ncbi:MAG: YeeE/YedE family protein [Rhodospirillales bacterium]|nr:YeeE/YedE family protein [Rhodospirillales bacterium]
MARILAAFAAGLLFGAGLAISRMIDPAVVLAFLDLGAIAEGTWDASLAFVMAGALAVTMTGYRFVLKRRAPLFVPAFVLPTQRGIDWRLISGAVIFGGGWGLVGYCPGPAVAGLLLGAAKTWIFVVAMLAGMAIDHWLFERAARASPPAGNTVH